MHVTGHYAAGVLPYTRLKDGRVLFLLGEDIRDCSFSDFGGKAERQDGCSTEQTACREFLEESFGLVITEGQLRNIFSSKAYELLRGTTRAGHPYYCYAIEVPFLPHLPSMAKKLIGFFKVKGLYKTLVEKTDFRWVTLHELFSPHLPKRQVFSNTIGINRKALEALCEGVMSA